MKKSFFITLTFLLTFIYLFPTSSFCQFTKLFDFSGDNTGSYPVGSLISDGTFLYGMTNKGGTYDYGTIFKIKPDGTGYVKLLDFAGASNGKYPFYSSLTFDGTFLYGMTNLGGANDNGVVFKIKPNGTGYVKLLDFAGISNGKWPAGSLISDGTFLYGMTAYGGANDDGVVFKIKSDGTGYVKLLDFAGVSNGANAYGGSLTFDGTFLYGMTPNGGTNNDGVIFKIKPDGMGYVKLLDFTGIVNGYRPYGSLISDSTFLYGMTSAGGVNGGSDGYGTIFKIKPDGTGYVKLLDLDSINGRFPMASLIYDGIFLYGMTSAGGANNDKGTIFKIKTDGTSYVKMFDFTGTVSGYRPQGSLISDGSFLYGMAELGGANDNGIIFKYQYCNSSIAFTQSPTVCAGQRVTVGTHTYTTRGTYIDSLISFKGCDSIVTTNLNVNPNYYIAPVLGNDTTFCGTFNFSLNAGTGWTSYQWSNGENSQVINIKQPGTYYITVKNTYCTYTSDTISVNSYKAPALGNDTSFCGAINFSLNAGASWISYHWSNGANSQEINITQNGKYYVTVRNMYCTFNSDTVLVNTLEDKMIISNLITPNGDQKNDEFSILNLIPNSSIAIYNTWGALIYKSDENINGWNIKDTSDGIYYYYFISGCGGRYYGWVEIIR